MEDHSAVLSTHMGLMRLVTSSGSRHVHNVHRYMQAKYSDTNKLNKSKTKTNHQTKPQGLGARLKGFRSKRQKKHYRTGSSLCLAQYNADINIQCAKHEVQQYLCLLLLFQQLETSNNSNFLKFEMKFLKFKSKCQPGRGGTRL